MGTFQPVRRKNAPKRVTDDPPPIPPVFEPEIPNPFPPARPFLQQSVRPTTTTAETTSPPIPTTPSQPPPVPQTLYQISAPPATHLGRIMSIFGFLRDHRIDECEKFSHACMNLYNANFRRSKPQNPANGQNNPPHTPSTPNPCTPSTPNPPQPPQHLPDSLPGPSSAPPASQAEPDVVFVSHRRAETVARQGEVKEPRSSSPEVLKITAPLYRGRNVLIRNVKQRWQVFMANEGKPRKPRTDDGTFYVLREGKNNGKPVLLESGFVAECPSLLNRDGGLANVHIDVLRFLWHYFVVDPCAGAVFNHGIGFPRTQVVLTFLHLLSDRTEKVPKQVLIVCPVSAVADWEFAASKLPQFRMMFLRFETCSRDISLWRKQGGVLVLTDRAYNQIIDMSPWQMREEALRQLCRPGPDMIILDEAPKVIAYSSTLRRYLNRTKTKLRLVLTSLPVGGNLVRYWFLADWAVPELLGTQDEFWQVYIQTIIRRHANEAQLIASHLYRTLQHIMFRVDAKTRLAALEEKGCRLREETVHVKLSEGHYVVYKRTERFLASSVRRKEISPYVAMHILLLASTGVSVLKSALLQGINDKDDFFGYHGESARRTLKKLHDEIEPLCSGHVASTKLDLVTQIACKRLRSEERLVIFVNVPEVLDALRRCFRDRLRNDEFRNVFHCNSSADLEERQKQVSLFNASRNGGVLVVPFGPVLECVEDSAWGHIKAAHVLVVGVNWNFATTAQVVQRALSFGNPVLQVVDIHYLLSANTVETSIHKHVTKLYVDLQNHVETSWSSIAENPLLLPKVPPSMTLCDTEDDYANSTSLTTSRAPSTLSASHEDLFADFRDEPELIKFEPCSKWYEPASECLELTAIMNPNEETRAARATTMEQSSYFDKMPRIAEPVEEIVWGREHYSRWQDTQVSIIRKKLCEHLNETKQQGAVLQYWQSYFLTYELEPPRRSPNASSAAQGDVSRKRRRPDHIPGSPQGQSRRRQI